MLLVDLMTMCFIVCLFSIGFKLLEEIKEEEKYETDLSIAKEEIQNLKSEIAYLNSYIEYQQNKNSKHS